MLRLLTTLPPGKVRFTIIDPVGLGENFAAFMHLADYDERLVTSRIWTEPAHIEQRLADLTEHMENVIQKYLRNEFASIEEYNAQAGEVAEPFRVLVVANFPANFTDEAARRLVSIAASGARCGVYTLISADTQADAAAQLRPGRSGSAGRHAASGTKPSKRFAWKHDDAAAAAARRSKRRPTTSSSREIVRSRRRAGQGRRPRRSAVRDRSCPPPSEWWTARQPQRDRRAARPGRGDEAAAPAARQGNVAARAHRRQDRLGQIDAAARADHEPRRCTTRPTRWSST